MAFDRCLIKDYLLTYLLTYSVCACVRASSLMSREVKRLVCIHAWTADAPTRT